MRSLILAAAIGGAVFAQTRVDLTTQAKNVDFSAATETKPLKTGTALPAICAAGDMFLLINATAGSNVYACLAANSWALQAGGGTVTISNNGSAVGSRPAENFIAGTGLVNAISDTGTQLNIQQSFDSAVLQTRAVAQAGTTQLCSSSSGSSSAYTCSMNPTLSGYTSGMVFFWKPDVSGTGAAVTLNIDTLGAKTVDLADGATTPTAADITAGKLYAVWYDGTVFRLLIPPVNVGAPGVTQPACSASLRGRIWQVFSATGVKDQVSVCAKDASDAYAWRTIY